MSETKHTPAPWIASGTWVSTSDSSLIANCGTDANAGLIAAAPDLLAACEGLVDWIDPNEAMDGLNREIDDARAAIAKAKGETS